MADDQLLPALRSVGSGVETLTGGRRVDDYGVWRRYVERSRQRGTEFMQTCKSLANVIRIMTTSRGGKEEATQLTETVERLLRFRDLKPQEKQLLREFTRALSMALEWQEPLCSCDEPNCASCKEVFEWYEEQLDDPTSFNESE